MKNILALFLILFFSFQGFSQRNPDMKVGLGMPFVMGNTSGTEISKVSGFPAISLEKPIPIKIDRDEKISFTPGASFSIFKEKEEWGTEVAGGSKNLNHFSLNGYAKLLYNLKLQRRSEAYIYLGGIFGAHITARTMGTEKLYSESAGYDEEKNIKQSGRDFFNSVYYGGILGFQPNFKVTNKFVPSFELAFYPNFVTRLNEDKSNAVQLTVLLGINN